MNDQVQIEDGKIAANIIATASPFVSQLFATVWNHLPGGIAQMIIPASVVHDAVQKVCGKLSSAVQGQVLAFSVPSGMVHDVVVELETLFPGFIHAVHQSDPQIANAMTAIGALPAIVTQPS